MHWAVKGGLWAIPSLWAGFNVGQEIPERPDDIQDKFFGAIDYRTWLLGAVGVYIYLNKDKKRTKTTHTKGWRTTATDLYSAKRW